MEGRSSSTSDRQLIEEAAAKLVIALSDGRAAPDALEAWLDKGPMHGVAFARARATWIAAERLKAAPPVIEPEAIAGPAGRFEAMLMRQPARAITMALSVCGIISIIATQAIMSVDRYHAGIGEKRSITLADGSTLRLNTGSTAEVLMRGGTRKVRLLEGEAMFDVARDRTRPFVVEAGTASFRAIGTEFNLRIRQDFVELTTIEGRVSVRDGQAPAGHTVVAGKIAAVRHGVIAESELDSAEIEQRTAWRSSTIELDGVTLAQATEEFNRYRSTPLVIGDPRIASLKMGGRFMTSDSSGFVAALARRFNIRAMEGSDRSVVLIASE